MTAPERALLLLVAEALRPDTAWRERQRAGDALPDAVAAVGREDGARARENEPEQPATSTEWTLGWFAPDDTLAVEVRLTPEQVAAIRRAHPDWNGHGCLPLTVHLGKWALWREPYFLAAQPGLDARDAPPATLVETSWPWRRCERGRRMSVYVDDVRHAFGRMVMCHLWADTPAELHAMADRIGVARKWFQQPPKASWEHYDIALGKKALALGAGAVLTDRYGPAEHVARLSGNQRMLDRIAAVRAMAGRSA